MTNKSTARISAGFSSALKYWLFFLVSFSLLGYPVPLSIFIGAIGGLAGGWVVSWSKAKDDVAPQISPAKTPEEKAEEQPKIGSQKRQRYGKPRDAYIRRPGSEEKPEE